MSLGRDSQGAGGRRRDERREPLPGLLGLPRFLLEGLPRRSRRLIAAIGVAVLASAGWAAVEVLPQSREEAREQAATERARQESARAARARMIAWEQRPRRGRAEVSPPRTAPRAERGRRRRMVHAVEGAVANDARERVRRGFLDGPIEGVRCRPFPPRADEAAAGRGLGGALGSYECLAATRRFGATEGTEAGALGHPYRAVLDFRTGSYALCWAAGRPGEGGLTRRGLAILPAECGG